MKIIPILATGVSVLGGSTISSAQQPTAPLTPPEITTPVSPTRNAVGSGSPATSPKKPMQPYGGPEGVLPSSSNLSTAQRQDIQKWLRTVLSDRGSQSGPNPDPYYSEFWIRMIKAGEPTSLASSALYLDGLRLAKEPKNGMIAELKAPNGGGVNISTSKFAAEYLEKKNIRTMADWSEKVFAEITPDFAEFDPASAEIRPTRAAGTFGAQGDVSVRIRQLGQPVSANHFQELLREIRKASVPGPTN